MKACTGKVVKMQQRLSTKAEVSRLSETYADMPELSEREWELVLYALRFCPVKKVIQRIDGSAARRILNQINDVT